MIKVCVCVKNVQFISFLTRGLLMVFAGLEKVVLLICEKKKRRDSWCWRFFGYGGDGVMLVVFWIRVFSLQFRKFQIYG